ncbi:helix-turn-helix transcriptional regulator [Nocardiopsis sp. FIRDI 009]|uniref:helix-turn-helix domain-containing protein n=1 Tax=Nocardiopsis sp. FIRDI 009 TaxID=714197 RepID=UPI000E27B210|nr:helix-turn-helix transcriptional regulator [Nocardiopsis sp. FIRDI 009]
MVDRPKPAWVEFGKHVRRLRTQANLSLDRLARLTTYSATYHSKIERAVRVPNVGIVEALDRELGTRGALLRMWRDVARSESGSWYEQPDEYEKEATEIRFFHPFVLPGFLQTESYARIITSHSVPNIDRESLEKTVGMRQAWRRLLRENEDLRLSVVIPEFVLTRLVGGAETMREQLERLIQESQTEGLTLQVLPEGISDFAWTVGAFWLVYIEDQSPIVCTEHCIGGHMTSEARYVRKLESAYNRLQVWALSPNDSLHKIKALRDVL